MINTKNVNAKPHVSVSLATRPPKLHALLSYLRYPVASALALLTTALGSILVIPVCVLFDHTHPWVQLIIRAWANLLLSYFNIRVEVSGLETLPADKGAIFLFNHASHFDIPILCSFIKQTSRFGAKIELFKIPVFSRAMRLCGVLPIARGQRDEVLRLYQASASRVANGESFILAPEGTRQTDAGIGRFKQGPFIFAIGAQAQIVPIVILGAREIMKKNSLLVMWGRLRHTVHVQVLPPVATEGKTVEQIAELQALVHQQMIEAYQSLRELSKRQR